MNIAEILKLTGASKPSIYRWMEKHPTLAVADPSSPLGHTFPKPRSKVGRTVIWDEHEVRSWWDANSRVIGRHPEEGPTTTMSWERFRAATLIPPQISEVEGEQVIDDHLEVIHKFEREGDNVRLWFRDATDAVIFKLTYC